jgi:GMP synthase (glutamine-hydrolysing)
VPADGRPRAPQCLFDSGLPILGICYGQQVMSHQLGRRSAPRHETAKAANSAAPSSTVSEGCIVRRAVAGAERHQVWMSHGDKVTRFAPGFRPVATTAGAPFAVIADDARRYYGTQFHPEVVHTPMARS